MSVAHYHPNAFDRIVVFLAAERARITTTAIPRPKTLCPDKSNK